MGNCQYIRVQFSGRRGCMCRICHGNGRIRNWKRKGEGEEEEGKGLLCSATSKFLRIGERPSFNMEMMDVGERFAMISKIFKILPELSIIPAGVADVNNLIKCSTIPSADIISIFSLLDWKHLLNLWKHTIALFT